MSKYDVSFKVGESGSDEVLQKLKEIQSYIDSLTKKDHKVSVGADIDTSGIKDANRQVEGLRQSVVTLGDVFQSIGSIGIGAGNLLQNFGSMFGADVIGTATRTVTSYGTILASQGLGKSIDRFDLMSSFPKMMEMMGYDAEEATEAVNTLNDAVLGLPTSLSDIVEQAQTFTTLTGDLDKGVQYAIAANNTFLAGGADSSQVYYGTKQLQDLISAGSLQSMEWQSLLKAMGPSWREIGKEMGYADDELNDFRSDLIAGDIDGTAFLDAMVKAGTGTGALADMAGLSKEKISSALANIQTAFASTGQAVIEQLDQGFQDAEGITLAEKIIEISDAIKTELKPYLTSLVQDNFPKIEEFIDKIEGYDWMGLIQKVGEAAGSMLDLYTNLLTKLPTGVVSFGMVFATPIGKILSSIGSFIFGLGNLKMLRETKIGKVADTVADTGSVITQFKNLFVQLAGAAGFVAIVGEVGLVIKEFAGVIQTISDLDISSRFGKNLKYVTAFMGSASVIVGGIVGLMTLLNTSGLGIAVIGGELVTAGLLAVIGLTGDVLEDYAELIGIINNMDIDDSKLDKNIDTLSKSMTKMQLIMGKNGLLSMVTGIFELWGDFTITADAAALKNVAETVKLLADVDDIDFDADKIEEDCKNIKEAVLALTDGYSIFSALFGTYKSGKMDEVVTNMKSILSTWIDIKKAYLGQWETDDGDSGTTWSESLNIEDGLAEAIAEEMSSIGDVVEAFVKGFGLLSTLYGSWSSEKIDTTIGNIKSILEKWIEIKGLFSSDTGESDVPFANQTLESANGTFSKTPPIVSYMNDMFSQIEQISNAMSGGSSILSKIGTQLSSAVDMDSSTSLSSVMANIVQIVTDFKSLQTSTEGLSADGGTAEKISAMFTELDSMFAGIPDPDYNEITSRLSSWIMFLDADHMLKVVEDMTALASRITEDGYNALNHIKTFFGTRMTGFNESIAEIDTADFDTRVQNVQHMFDRVNILLAVINAIELDDAREKVGEMQTMMSTEVTNFLNSLITIQDLLNTLGASGDEIPVIQMLTNLFTGLDGAMESEGFAGFHENLTLLTEDIDNIAFGIYDLNNELTILQPVIESYATVMAENLLPSLGMMTQGIGYLNELFPLLSDAIFLFRDTQLMLLIDDLETLYGWVMDDAYAFEVDFVYALAAASTQILITKADVEALTIALQNLKTATDNARNSMMLFASQLQRTKTQIDKVKTACNELAAAIRNIPEHKTITIDIVTNGEVPTFASTGGYIAGAGKVLYRAKGGFTPKGTDTVPAMLTPGEYVMRKKAVDTYGAAFFQRLNHLDIRGAMARVGLRPNTITSYVNNTTNRDNHATVNQYITTKNEQYSYRRARRFVEAL